MAPDTVPRHAATRRTRSAHRVVPGDRPAHQWELADATFAQRCPNSSGFRLRGTSRGLNTKYWTELIPAHQGSTFVFIQAKDVPFGGVDGDSCGKQFSAG